MLSKSRDYKGKMLTRKAKGSKDACAKWITYLVEEMELQNQELVAKIQAMAEHEQEQMFVDVGKHLAEATKREKAAEAAEATEATEAAKAAEEAEEEEAEEVEEAVVENNGANKRARSARKRKRFVVSSDEDEEDEGETGVDGTTLVDSKDTE